MMNKTFKLSALAVSVLTATQTNAALYRIVEVPSTGEMAYGVAIEAASIAKETATATELLGCFGVSCTDNEYSLAGDTRESFSGFSYKQEVPFGMDNRFYYLDWNDLENYCYKELRYSTCDSWAYNHWFGSNNSVNGIGGLYREREAWKIGTYPSNASAFLESTPVLSPDSLVIPTGSSLISDSKNVVVNALDGTTIIGNTNSGYFSIGANAALMYRDRGFYGSTLLLPKQKSQGADSIVEQMGRTMAFDSFALVDPVDPTNSLTYVVGSGSVAPFAYRDNDKDYLGDLAKCVLYSEPAVKAECQNFAFAMKPYIWDVSAGGSSAIGISASFWNDIGDPNSQDDYLTANSDDYSAQGSIRAAVIPTLSGSYKNKPVFAGYNTTRHDSRLLMQAAVFYPNRKYDTDGVSENAWTTIFIADATVRVSGEDIYSHSVATDINENMLVIGEAKRLGYKPEAGSANNRLFIADASLNMPRAHYFSGGIFFPGAGGEANAINNFNEIVGQIDAEDSREIDGKKRRVRGFIYPYDGLGTDFDRRNIFRNQAWWIDDLTNGDNGNGHDYSADNNHYRIINASDINDAGVISATALKCTTGEYDSTAHNSYCGGGAGDEKIIAVKLIPIEGATSDHIFKRSTESSIVKRKGGSIGIFILSILGLIGFKRRKK